MKNIHSFGIIVNSLLVKKKVVVEGKETELIVLNDKRVGLNRNGQVVFPDFVHADIHTEEKTPNKVIRCLHRERPGTVCTERELLHYFVYSKKFPNIFGEEDRANMEWTMSHYSKSHRK